MEKQHTVAALPATTRPRCNSEFEEECSKYYQNIPISDEGTKPELPAQVFPLYANFPAKARTRSCVTYM